MSDSKSPCVCLILPVPIKLLHLVKTSKGAGPVTVGFWSGILDRQRFVSLRVPNTMDQSELEASYERKGLNSGESRPHGTRKANSCQTSPDRRQ